MRSSTNFRFPLLIAQAALGVTLLSAVLAAVAQAPARFVGAITAISGNTLTVKTDADGAHQVKVPATASLKRITPGEKNLSAAETILFSGLAVGDRALIKLDPDAPSGTEEALQIIAVKQADLASRQQKEREDWQRRGVGGLVKSVDPTTGVILLASGAGATARTITVHTTNATMFKRYAPGSVRFDAALPAPIGAIRTGDQVRARGTKNLDGTEIAAEEVVSGSFRNISGTIASIDAAASTLEIKDLATKKQVTVHITAEAQMRRLPDMMARMLAMRLKGGTSGGVTSTRNGGSGSWGGGNSGVGNAGGDSQQLLNHAPLIQLSDLKKGEAVMLVSTEGTSEVAAITLLTGVEPLLESPEASQNLLSSWSMSAGESDVSQ